MKKVYVNISSLEELIDNIAKNKEIIYVERNIFNPNGYETKYSIYDLDINDIVALEKMDKDSKIVFPYEWVVWNGITVVFP